MPSDEVINNFVNRLGPELLLIVGILIILAYVVIKVVPTWKELRVKKLDQDKEIAIRKLEFDENCEKRKSEEFEKENERDRMRSEVIGQQNKILENVAQTNEAMALQMAVLAKGLEEARIQDQDIDNKIIDTNSTVHIIHNILMKPEVRKNG